MSAVMAGETLPGYRYHLLRGALERFSKNLAELDERQMAVARAQADKTWGLESLVLGSPEAGEIVIPPEQVDAAFAEVAGRYADDKALYADLAANGLDEARLRQALYRELVFDSVMQRVAARRLKVSQIDARLYYELHPEKFSQPEQRTARQILITINEDFVENTRSAARARIGGIAAKLAVSPNRFADQARKHSECPSALEGGKLGTVSRGQLFPELDSALFAMREGGISDVLETEVGFHLLWCEKILPARTLPFSRSEDAIRQLLDKRNQRNCQKAWLKRLKADQGEEVTP
jgi:peptidyl-prolyl cis-trans isomerase C